MSEDVVAVDPGKTCGIAVGRLGKGNPKRKIEAYEMDPMEAVKFVDGMLGGSGLVAVVCESFVPRFRGTYTWQPDAMEVIGGLRYVCYKHVTPFYLQSPTDAKKFSTNEKLKKIDWRCPTKGGHADDALRHLLLFAVRGDLIDPEELIS